MGAGNCQETPFFPEALEHLAPPAPREPSPLHLFPSPPALGLETPLPASGGRQGWPGELGATPKYVLGSQG